METLAADGRFNRFIDLITQAGITDQLRSRVSVTVFAPVDAAFDVVNARITELTAQGSGNINQNSADPLRLREFLAYHIVSGPMPSSGLLDGRRFKTVNGAEILVANDGSKIAISNLAPERQLRRGRAERPGAGAGGRAGHRRQQRHHPRRQPGAVPVGTACCEGAAVMLNSRSRPSRKKRAPRGNRPAMAGSRASSPPV